MGDSPGTAVLLLLVPVWLAPAFALVKWAILSVLDRTAPVPLRFVGGVALAETCLPVVSFACAVAIRAVLTGPGVAFPWLVFGLFAGLALAWNYGCLVWTGRRARRTALPTAIALAAGASLCLAIAHWALRTYDGTRPPP